MRKCFNGRYLLLCAAPAVFWAGPVMAANFPGALYLTFGSDGIAAVNLSNPTSGLGALNDTATNVVGDPNTATVYFQDGSTIYSSSENLIGLNSLVTTAQPPNGIAIDPADGILYEAFDAGTVLALDLANPTTAISFLSDSATAITYADGTVYFLDGNTVYSTSKDLVGLNTVKINPQAPTDIAVDPVDGILYETFGSGGISAISLADPTLGLGVLNDPATNVVYSDGSVFFQSGNTIYSSSPDLVGLQTVDSTPDTPTDFAIIPAAVPEPASLGLLLAGTGLLTLRRRHRRTAR